MQILRYSFVIITPGRCGSEHLSETLNHYEDITVDGEIFNRSNYGSNSFNDYLRKSAFRLVFGFVFNRGRLSRYQVNFPLRYAINKFLRSNHCGTSSISGFKLTLDQLHAYPYILDILLKKECKIIYLYREDKLAQVLSLVKARNTGQYHSRVKNNTSEAYTFDVEQVSRQYWQLMEWECNLMRRLKNVSFYSLSYESLFEAYQQSIDAIRAFLNLPKSDIVCYSNLLKSNPSELKAWVSNLEELRRAVARTRSKK